MVCARSRLGFNTSEPSSLALFVHPIGQLVGELVLLAEGQRGVFQPFLALLVGEPLVGVDDGLVNVDVLERERLVVDLHLDGVCKPVLVRDERADGLCEDRRKHGWCNPAGRPCWPA